MTGPARGFALCACLAAVARLGAASNDRVVLPDSVAPVSYAISFEPDADRLSFRGSVAIDIEIRRPTDRITLNAADLALDRVSLSGETAIPAVSTDLAAQTATFTFPRPLATGRRTLSIDYSGKINVGAFGIFALDYHTSEGSRRALYTQFENSDARRFVPCWDEPALKAVFSLSARVPRGLMAVSNMPIESTAEDGGLKLVNFAPSPRMSSYLLFFALGDFERIHRQVAGVDVGVVVKRGDTSRAQYALDTASRILPYYNDYFGTPYPLPKLDLIAGPGRSQFFSAMENWGAIFYFENAVLWDPKFSTDGDQQRVFVVIAHEMSHQWFGDLVTMDWWDDIWLNEGFASWMQEKATHHFHPEWHEWAGALGAKNAAMQVDAREGTHPVITHITDVFQANDAFDTITYSKGQAVIRMLEAYIGEDAFRAGVRRYMQRHAYANTVTNDLWRDIDAVSPTPLTGIAQDLTLQPGVPLVSVDLDKGQLILSESRFASDPSGAGGGSWRLPVIVGPLGSGGSQRVRLVVNAGTPVRLSEAGDRLLVNAGQTGYFRTLYKDAAFTAVRERFAALSIDDQVGILEDTAALGTAGLAPLSRLMELGQALPANADSLVWNELAERLESLDRLQEGEHGHQAFRSFAAGILERKLREVGWDARPAEPQNTAILREALLELLGRFGDTAVIAEARRRFEAYLADPSGASGSGRMTFLRIVARQARPADWERLHALAHAAPSSPDRNALYGLLGSANDPVLAQRALLISLTEELPPNNRPDLVRSVSREHPLEALSFALRHWDKLSADIEADSQPGFVPRLLGNATDASVIRALVAFTAAHFPASADRAAKRMAAAVRYNAAVRELRLPPLYRWLEEHSGDNPP